MALVTFMSDFGTEDHYVAAVKAGILAIDAKLIVIDISHHINPSDIGHAAYVLKCVFRDFPIGTVHICALDLNAKRPSQLIGLKLEGHFFLGYDCGLFSLLSTQSPELQVLLKVDNLVKSTFVAKDVLAPIAAQISNGKPLEDFGTALPEIKTLFARHLKVTKREIAGNVIRVDHYGNLISNILKSEFETIMRINGNKGFEVHFGRESISKLHTDFHEVESGECFVFFNSNGLLQIGINKGNASELLGLHHDYPIAITFET